MARSALQDPLEKFRWIVSVSEKSVGFPGNLAALTFRTGFSETTVPGFEITTKSYPEGGAHLTPRQIPDSIAYLPVTLSRGRTNDPSFTAWATGFFDKATNNAQSPYDVFSFCTITQFCLCTGLLNAGTNQAASNSNITLEDFNYRRDVRIRHTNRAGQLEVLYVLYNAFPIRYLPASDFNSLDDEGVSIETIVLGYEGFEVRYPGLAGIGANVAANKNIL